MAIEQDLQGTLNLVVSSGNSGDPWDAALLINNPGASPAPEPLASKKYASGLVGGMVEVFGGDKYQLRTTVAYP